MTEGGIGNDLVFKVIVIGDSGGGKSCLIQRYLTDQFLDHYAITLGVQYHTKIVKIDENINIKLKFWDTAGQQAFNSIVKSFYRNSHVVVFVYDITRRQTFENLDRWQMQALQNAPQEAIFVLVGTHLDLAQNRQVSQDEAKRWMQEADIHIFFQTSAKTAQNVKKMFDQVCRQLLVHHINKPTNNSNAGTISLQPIDKTTNSSCC